MLIKELNREYFNREEWKDITYRGFPLYKYPADLVTYQQIIHDVRPDAIVETGTCEGGSSLFFYDTMKSVGIEPFIVTIDNDPWLRKTPKTEGIITIGGSSLDTQAFQKISYLVEGKKVMVALDSDHIKDHVYEEMKIYSPLVSIDSYLVVEDTFLGVYDLTEGKDESRFRPTTGGNPYDAVCKFLKDNDNFEIDYDRDKVISMTPHGFLKRIS